VPALAMAIFVAVFAIANGRGQIDRRVRVDRGLVSVLDDGCAPDRVGG